MSTLLDEIGELIAESEGAYVTEVSAGAKWAYFGISSVLTFQPITLIGFAIYRYMTSIKYWTEKVNEYEAQLKSVSDPKRKLNIKLQLMKAQAKYDQAVARTKQEKIKYSQIIEKSKFELSQFKPPHTPEVKKKMDDIRLDMANAQKVLAKAGI